MKSLPCYVCTNTDIIHQIVDEHPSPDPLLFSFLFFFFFFVMLDETKQLDEIMPSIYLSFSFLFFLFPA